MGIKERIGEIEARRARARAMGGAEAVRKQHLAGKLTARDRIERLFDPGTFIEIGILGHHQSTHPDMIGRETPADGCITGTGKINGRLACCAAYDFTVMAGSIGYVQEKKVTRMRELALKERIPMIWLLDSAGARIQELAGSQFAESGQLFYEQVKMSGVVPQIAAMMGPCAAGTAYIPALADFVPMVKGTSSMALAGPPLVKAVIGEEISPEDLGGSKIHCEKSGVGDLEVEDDEACIAVIKDYLGYFPQHSGEKPVRLPGAEARRLSDDILDILPESSSKPFDMHEVITRIVDGGKTLEIKPAFAKNIITALARIGGFSVGIVANQSTVMGGVLDNDSSDKAARFINLSDAFNIPLVFLQDVPGFMVGSKVEHAGIIRHGAKMLYAVSRASVPKLTVVIRKAYGAGYYVMCGKGYEPDLLVAWPTAEISLMGAEGAVGIISQKKSDSEKEALIAAYKKEISIEKAAASGYIDDIIDPRDTRSVLVGALELSQTKQIDWPKKKHGVTPV